MKKKIICGIVLISVFFLFGCSSPESSYNQQADTYNQQADIEGDNLDVVVSNENGYYNLVKWDISRPIYSEETIIGIIEKRGRFEVFDIYASQVKFKYGENNLFREINQATYEITLKKEDYFP
jgi:hypothetical protein